MGKIAFKMNYEYILHYLTKIVAKMFGGVRKKLSQQRHIPDVIDFRFGARCADDGDDVEPDLLADVLLFDVVVDGLCQALSFVPVDASSGSPKSRLRRVFTSTNTTTSSSSAMMSMSLRPDFQSRSMMV